MEKLDLVKSKIYLDYSGIEFSQLLAFWRFKSKRIVFTNGCFDILHRGHVEYLAKTAQEGDVLVIGLNDDNSVTKIKGEGRPVQDQESRAMLLASLQYVSAVVLFNEETPLNLIKLVQPDVLVKGADYSLENIVGAGDVLAKGGEVKTIEFVEGYSTSSILNKVQSK
jgi:rfaE bifunctional protein nucleotidyltransferase chain/domain